MTVVLLEARILEGHRNMVGERLEQVQIGVVEELGQGYLFSRPN